MSTPALEHRVRRLERLNAALALALAAALAAAFTAQRITQSRQRFTELDVERLNVVDSAGRPLLVLANGPRLPGPMVDGRSYPPAWVGRGRVAGMIFFSAEGDEVGGLIYDGQKTDSGYSAVGHLSFDQWKQNQVVALQYSDDGRSRYAGLNVWDRPTDAPMRLQFAVAESVQAATGPRRDTLRARLNSARERVAGVRRLFIGSQDRSAQVVLRDTRGRVRARLLVDSTDAARLEFLDESGRVTATFPR